MYIGQAIRLEIVHLQQAWLAFAPAVGRQRSSDAGSEPGSSRVELAAAVQADRDADSQSFEMDGNKQRRVKLMEMDEKTINGGVGD